MDWLVDEFLFSTWFWLLGSATSAVTAYSWKRVHQRRRRLLHRAAYHADLRGWEFREGEQPHLVTRFTQPPFGLGFDRGAYNSFTGHHGGRAFTAFSYRYRSHFGSNGAPRDFLVVALHLGTFAPFLEVGPSRTMSRLWGAPSNADVAVGDPAFDEAFRVKTVSPEFARDVLCPAVREVLWHHRHLTWWFERDSMLVAVEDMHGPHLVDAHLHFMDAVLDRIPPLVWSRLRGQSH